MSAIDSLARRHGIDHPDDRRRLTYLIREMDRAYLDRAQAKPEVDPFEAENAAAQKRHRAKLAALQRERERGT